MNGGGRRGASGESRRPSAPNWRGIYAMVPIDECYKLVGLIRTHWKGFGGGTEVWQEIEKFFVELRGKAGVQRKPRNRMPDLNFQVESVEVVPYAATPLLAFHLRVENAVAGEVVHTAALRCQIQIEATRRSYTPEEQSRLLDLYGEPDAGVRRCALCFGRMPMWSCRNLPA